MLLIVQLSTATRYFIIGDSINLERRVLLYSIFKLYWVKEGKVDNLLVPSVRIDLVSIVLKKTDGIEKVKLVF